MGNKRKESFMEHTYDFDTPIDRTGTCCIKWDRRKGKFQDDQVLPMWIADTDFACPQEVTEAITRRCAHPIFGYSFPRDQYFTSIIDWFASRHGLSLKKEWIRPSCGVVTSISYCIQALTSPGDKVLIQPPVYDPFQAVIAGAGRRVVENPLIHTDNTYTMDFDHLEQAFQEGVRMMILCNPHNPVGRVWSREEITRLVSLCVQYQVYLVSDEIHCDIELFGNHYTSVLAVPEGHPYTISCIAPGKTFNVSGLAISSLLVPNQDLNDRIGSQLRSAWLINPSVLALEASAAAYTHGSPWLDAQLAYLEDNARLVASRLAAEAPSIVPAKLEGTFLMWLDFSAFGLTGARLQEELIHTWHLGFNDGPHFGTGGEGFMRMNIGCNRSLINQAVDNLVKMHLARNSSRSI